MTDARAWDVTIVTPTGRSTLLGGSETYAELVERVTQLGRDRKWLPPAAPLTVEELDRLIGLVEHTERKASVNWSGDADLRQIIQKLRAMKDAVND